MDLATIITIIMTSFVGGFANAWAVKSQKKVEKHMKRIRKVLKGKSLM